MVAVSVEMYLGSKTARGVLKRLMDALFSSLWLIIFNI